MPDIMMGNLFPKASGAGTNDHARIYGFFHLSGAGAVGIVKDYTAKVEIFRLPSGRCGLPSWVLKFRLYFVIDFAR